MTATHNFALLLWIALLLRSSAAPAETSRPSEQVQQFLDQRLATVLMPLGDPGDQPRIKIAKQNMELRQQFSDALASAPESQKPVFAAAIEVCEGVAQVIEEHDKALADLQSSSGKDHFDAIRSQWEQKRAQLRQEIESRLARLSEAEANAPTAQQDRSVAAEEQQGSAEKTSTDAEPAPLWAKILATSIVVGIFGLFLVAPVASFVRWIRNRRNPRSTTSSQTLGFLLWLFLGGLFIAGGLLYVLTTNPGGTEDERFAFHFVEIVTGLSIVMFFVVIAVWIYSKRHPEADLFYRQCPFCGGESIVDYYVEKPPLTLGDVLSVLIVPVFAIGAWLFSPFRKHLKQCLMCGRVWDPAAFDVKRFLERKKKIEEEHTARLKTIYGDELGEAAKAPPLFPSSPKS